jgi:hypothetical protein
MDYDIDFSLFNLSEDAFDHHSQLHGVGHTYRVMYHTLFLGTMTGLKKEAKTAFCAAYIHDLARQHDGLCSEHGLWSKQKKLPEYIGFFKDAGIPDEEIEIIGLAVENHSETKEIPRDHLAYNTTALLKDADALDRFRLGETELKTELLRFPQSRERIIFAKKLFFAMHNLKFHSFTDILILAESIDE